MDVRIDPRGVPDGAHVDPHRPRIIWFGPRHWYYESLSDIIALLSHETLHGVLILLGEPKASRDLDALLYLGVSHYDGLP